MINIFAYGTLMFEQVWSQVAKGNYDRCAAILKGYDRKSLRGEMFPAIIPSSPASLVQGVVYLEVSPSDLEGIDRFEGEYYFRKSVLVDTMETGIISAETYQLKEEYYALLSHRNWDAEQFSSTGIHLFIRSFMDPGTIQ